MKGERRAAKVRRRAYRKRHGIGMAGLCSGHRTTVPRWWARGMAGTLLVGYRVK